SVLFYKNQLIEGKPILNNQVVDAIGAGDSFNAGFIYKFLKDNPAEKCQVFANLVGAVSTTSAGGTGAFINYQEVIKIAKEKFAYGEC
ncbi:MAG: carbohydrate kinase family protein, partial [Chitinophagaceae bacterium]|nr:carbohydrate kinase family protein [Chitinophagaceae bacterium]